MSISETTPQTRVLTGRAVHNPKLRADRDTHRLDLASLSRAGFFARPAGQIFTSLSEWPGGFVSKVLLGRAESAGRQAVAISHTKEMVGGSWAAPVTYPVMLTATEPHLGGLRWWWMCPGCRGRARILHRVNAPSSRFYCARCWGLSYTSRQMSRHRLYETITRPERALGALERVRDPRCSLRRRYRALQRAEKTILGYERLVGGDAR